MSAQNPRKRAAPALPGGGGGPDRKRTKLHTARAIAVQSSDPSHRAGALSVPAFIESRQFEIAALEASIAASKRANNRRAFQLVPRALRRRTASHNVKRVPKRLRRRAAHEMAADNTPTVTARRRKKSGGLHLRAETARKLKTMAAKRGITAALLATTPRSRATENTLRLPPRAANKFRKRQREKTWLPTHVWHAKRARMLTRWRFSVAETPNEKSYRPTHRACQLRGAVAWDESYVSTVLLSGGEDGVTAVLRAMTGKGTEALAGPVVAGQRACEAWLYHPGAYPTGLIAPATLIWCAGGAGGARRLFLRVHPAAFLELWTSLLPLARAHAVTLEDLRFEIGTITLTGPSATDTLLSVLHPADPSSPPAALWAQLRTLTNPSALPPGALLPLTVTDPRLRSPARMDEDALPPAGRAAALFAAASTWPASPLPASPLFVRADRTAAVRAQPSQKRINKRKAAAAPGGYPAPHPADPCIPVLLFATRNGGGMVGSWSVLLPWKWVLPVWYGVVGCAGVRFGGLREREQGAFEGGVASFPGDWPGTRAGGVEEGRRGAERRECWGRRPKGKRMEWGGKVGHREVGDPFVCDWGWLVGDRTEEGGEAVVEEMDIDPSTDPLPEAAQRPTTATTTTTTIAPAPPVWPLPPLLAQHLLTHPTAPLPPLLSTLPPPLLARAIITVKLTYLHRGTPSSRARIYRLPSSSPWHALVSNQQQPGARKKKAPMPKPGMLGYPSVPEAAECIGFVTSGNFSLKDGLGVGVGAVLWARVCGRRAEGEGAERGGRVCVVKDVGSEVGRVARWEVV